MGNLIQVSKAGDLHTIGDVVFVHGLEGDPHKTWTNKTGGYWPEWLANDHPELTVWSVGYEAASSGWRGTAMPLFDRANHILAELKAGGLGQRPICFVAHSMGGLIVKKLLSNADTLASEFRSFSTATRGVIFLATPHVGSDLANIARYLGFLLRLTIASKEVQALAPPLIELNTWYRENARRLGIATQVFFENQPTNGVFVVDRVSADPSLEGVIPIGLDANHFDICKPPSKNSLVYKRTRAFILDVLTRDTSLSTPPAPIVLASSSPPQQMTYQNTNQNGLLYDAFGRHLRDLFHRAGLDAQGVAETITRVTGESSPVTLQLVNRWLAGERAPHRRQCLALVSLLVQHHVIQSRAEVDRLTELLAFRFDEEELSELELEPARNPDLHRSLPGVGEDVAPRPLQAYQSLRDNLRDFNAYIKEKTEGFVGRAFLFDALESFMSANSSNRSGYFVVQGEPGIGKTSFAAQLVRTKQCVHHFNIAARNIRSASAFLSNVCAQLIIKYGLNYRSLPPDHLQDGGFLAELLTQVSRQRNDSTEKCIVVIDALDEVDVTSVLPGTNALFLPEDLPPGVFMVVTQRFTSAELRIDCAKHIFDLFSDSGDNIADIHEFLREQLRSPKLQRYLAVNNITHDAFIEILSKKSEYNFMYLRFVIPELENGAYRHLDIDHLPIGLRGYYNDHWQRMRGLDESSWFAYRLRVLCTLALVREPVSVSLLAKLTGEPRTRVREVLNQWKAFLREEFSNGADKEARFRIYHGSFLDYLAEKEEIADERVHLGQIHDKIAQKLWQGTGL